MAHHFGGFMWKTTQPRQRRVIQQQQQQQPQPQTKKIRLNKNREQPQPTTIPSQNNASALADAGPRRIPNPNFASTLAGASPRRTAPDIDDRDRGHSTSAANLGSHIRGIPTAKTRDELRTPFPNSTFSNPDSASGGNPDNDGDPDGNHATATLATTPTPQVPDAAPPT